MPTQRASPCFIKDFLIPFPSFICFLESSERNMNFKAKTIRTRRKPILTITFFD